MARLSLSSGRALRGPGGDSGDRATQSLVGIARRSHLLGWTAPDGIECARVRSLRSQTREPSMSEIIRIGIDTSKSVFQLHGVSASEAPVLKKKLRRSQLVPWLAKLGPTKIGIEACGGSHHLARTLKALGHEVVLVPPQYAKPYVARGKNDAADAEAICEAMSRPKVQKRFVAVKAVEQQAGQMLVGTREQLVRRRTQISNAMRGYATEFGHVAPKGLAHLDALLLRVEEDTETPELAKELFRLHRAPFAHVQVQL